MHNAKTEKVLNFREFVIILNKNGYVLVRTSGSHHIFKNGTNTITINRNPNRMIVRRLIKENNLKY